MDSVTIEKSIQTAIAHHQAGRLAEAEDIYRQVLKPQPNHPQALHLLGVIALQCRRYELAIELIGRAIAFTPQSAEFHANLGEALRCLGRLDESIRAFCRAIELNPSLADAHGNLGLAMYDHGRLDEAIASYGRAIQLNPDYAIAYNNLSNALKDQGRIDQALTCLRKAVSVASCNAAIHGNLVYTLCFHPDYDARRILDESLEWARRHATPLAGEIRPLSNDTSPHRRLRIGYLSPNFRVHSIACFLYPLLRRHDKRNVEVFCYADVAVEDDMTHQMRDSADGWRNTVGLSDEQVAQQVRADRIDILVDLTLHLAGSRLLVFARKPAPVQATWLAYPGTSGLDTMDYRLTDPHLDPPGQGDENYTERSIRLPHCYWCYSPIFRTPAVNKLPALSNGFFTFGSFNNFWKVTEETLQLWVRLLQTVPRSRLLIHSKMGNHRESVRRIVQAGQIAPERLEFIEKAVFDDYIGFYHRVDICLDPTPHAGGTTTFDGLWMGVPVVTLTGRTAVARLGASLLSNVGLPELIAHTPDEYVLIAARLASDIPHLAKLRASLRDRLRNSPLMDAPAFARDMEAAYRQMWRTFCDNLQTAKV